MPESTTQSPPADLAHRAGLTDPALNWKELQEVLEMYNTVTQRLQVSHENLQAEVVRLTEQLDEKNRELERRQRLAALGEMAAGIAHEIRNPLGGIQLYASTLAAEVTDRPLAAQLVEKISRGVKSLNALVTDMLGFTQNIAPSCQSENLRDIVDQTAELAAAALQQHTITLQLDDSINVAVRVDARLLGRVLLNLVLNAADALGESNVPHKTISITAAPHDADIQIYIADNGPGIPADILESIFNPFFTTKHTGTGLGLAIVHRIVEAHGGRITAENQTTGGARFTITLPA
jgi:signal transduction histidine kinase